MQASLAGCRKVNGRQKARHSLGFFKYIRQALGSHCARVKQGWKAHYLTVTFQDGNTYAHRQPLYAAHMRYQEQGPAAYRVCQGYGRSQHGPFCGP